MSDLATLTEQRQRAREDGWHTEIRTAKGVCDFCPGCFVWVKSQIEARNRPGGTTGSEVQEGEKK